MTDAATLTRGQLLRLALGPRPAPEPPAPVPVPDPPLLRFATLGGAVVELREHKFRTTYAHCGKPYGLPDGATRECAGFRWTCLGCGGTDRRHDFYDPGYLDTEHREARDDANDHAAACRAMPRDAPCTAP
jgi:hypothetical protein